MALARTLRTKLHEVVVALAIGNQTRELEEFRAFAHLSRIKTDGTDKDIDPLVHGEVTALLSIALEVESRHLDGLELLQ